MSKPTTYRETHILAVDTPYQNADKTGSGTHASEGVLRQGRVVWSQSTQGPDGAGDKINVYAEGVGLVDLPPEVLLQDRLAGLRR